MRLLAAALALGVLTSGLLDEADRLRARGKWIDAYQAYRRAASAAQTPDERTRAEEGIRAIHREAAAVRARRPAPPTAASPATASSATTTAATTTTATTTTAATTATTAPPAPTTTLPPPLPPPSAAPSLPSISSARAAPEPLPAPLAEVLGATPAGTLSSVSLRAPVRVLPSAPAAGSDSGGPADAAAALLRDGRTIPAYLLLTRAIQAAAPRGGDARLELFAAYAAFRVGLYREALAHSVAAEELAREGRALARARLNHALILRRMSRPREALTLLSEIPPDVPGRDLLEANLLTDLGQYDAATEILVRLADRDPIASHNYAGVLVEEGRPKEAALHLERLYEAWPDDVVILSRARARAAAKDYPAAIRDYERIRAGGNPELANFAALAIKRLEAEGGRR